MSKKLLNESTIRKFMKLANIEPLADGLVDRPPSKGAFLF